MQHGSLSRAGRCQGEGYSGVAGSAVTTNLIPVLVCKHRSSIPPASIFSMPSSAPSARKHTNKRDDGETCSFTSARAILNSKMICTYKRSFRSVAARERPLPRSQRDCERWSQCVRTRSCLFLAPFHLEDDDESNHLTC